MILNDKCFYAGVLACTLNFPVYADDFFLGRPYDSEDAVEECENTDEECVGKWGGSVEFGYVAVSGNKDTKSMNGRFKLSYDKEKWFHEGFLATVTSSSKEVVDGNLVETNAEKYIAQAKSNYKYSANTYAFAIFDFDDTKDSGFEYQASLSLGGGYRFINTEVHSLDGELGFGMRTSKTEPTLLLPPETNNEGITRVAGLYKWRINENAEFEQKLSSDIGENNTITKSYTSLSANVIENLALKLSYAIKHQSEVPVGNEKRETITAFTVVYSF